MANLTVTEFLTKWDNDEFNSGTISMIEAGWYDWFCDDKALFNRTKELVSKVKFMVKERYVNPDECYVWFKNNCPMNGSTYDDFRFADLETGENILGCAPASGHTSCKGEASLWFFPKNKDGFKTFEEPKGWAQMKKDLKTQKYAEVRDFCNTNPKKV